MKGYFEHNLLRYTVNGQGVETLRMKQSRFARMIILLLLFIDEAGLEVTFGDAWAKEGHMNNSLHYIRLAFDLNLFKNGNYLTHLKDYKAVGEYWESIGGSWGGRFGDACHFSLAHDGRR